MRPIFCGNFDFDARSGDLERLFRRYGKVDRVDMKSGFAFIYMDDERDAEYAIRALDRTEFGRKGRRLRVEWTKHERNERGDRVGDRGDRGGDRGVRKSASSRRSANLKPSKTLFVINFPYDTQTRDLERHFDPYGKIANVRIRKNFAFVQYESQEDATRALDATNMSKMLDRVISVEYSARDDTDRKGGESSPNRRRRDRSPDRRRRSPSPYKRERGSPDYGTGAAYSRERGSPEYVRGSSRSPRRSLRSSPKYDRPSPPIEKEDVPIYRRDRSRSPREEGAISHRRDRSRSPREEGAIPDYRSRSPHEEGAISDYHRDRSLSPRGGARNGNGYDRRRSRSPYKREDASPVIDREGRSPANNEPEMKEDGEYESPVEDRYKSRSPVTRERSQS